MFQKLFTRLNEFLYRLTGGLIGSNLGGAKVLLLTTIGRKTGKPRTTPLRYLPQGDGYMIAASNWGQEKLPAWFTNLQANPLVTIQVTGSQMTARAEVAPDEQHEALYAKFIEADWRFAEYPKTAKRTIPVVLLHPNG